MLTLIGIVAAVVVVAVIANWKLQFFKWDLMDEMKKFDEDAKKNYTVPTPKTLPAEESKPVTVEVTPTEAKVETPAASVTVETKPQRAKDSKGKFVADNPATSPVNEAWVGGVAPAKKPEAKKPANKPAAKKAPARRPAAKK